MSDIAIGEIVVSYRAVNNLRGLLGCIREFESQPYRFSDEAQPIRVALAGNYSTQFLAKGLPLALAVRGVRAAVFEGSYNNWQFDLLDGVSPLYAFEPTHLLLALTSIDLAYGVLRTPANIAKAVSAAAENVLVNTDARLFITLPEPLSEEISDQSEAYLWRRDTRTLLEKTLTDSRISLIDLDPLVRQVGASKWYDERFYDTSKLPFHPDQTYNVLERLAIAIVGSIAPQCKLVICDLDDTLWAGRVGDEGWQGVNLDATGAGRHHLRLQLFLKGLIRQGVLLAIASKNEVKPVREVFENRPEMLLGLDDFVLSQIHWEPKSVSVERILTSLNLTTTGVIFLDDNPAEREEVRRRLPEVVIPELPENPALWVQKLIETGLFDRRVVTEESTKRQRMYQENAQRAAQLASSSNINAFLADLNMEMTVYDAANHRDRVLELIQKTNQFNLTTRRYDWAEIETVTNGGFALCHRLTDRFGDNGIVSVLLAKPTEPGEFSIELFLMSCRVMSRTAENAIMDDLVRRLASIGVRRLIGRYIPTSKNKPVSGLYERLGFVALPRDSDGPHNNQSQHLITERDETTYEYHIDGGSFASSTTHIRVVDMTEQASKRP